MDPRKRNIYISLIGAMIAGRAISLSVMLIAINAFGIKLPQIFGTILVFSAGVPSMIVQIILVPILVLVLRRFLNADSILSVN